MLKFLLLLQYFWTQSSTDSLFIIIASRIFPTSLGSLSSLRCFGRLLFSLRLLGTLVIIVLLTFICMVFSTLTRLIFPPAKRLLLVSFIILLRPASRLLLISLTILLIFAIVLLISSLISGSAASLACYFLIGTLILLVIVLFLTIVSVEVRIFLFIITTVASTASTTLLARPLMI